MANCKKYTRAACGHLFKHYERAKDENGEYIKFGNQDIDISRTHLNYNLAPMQANGQGGFIRERCSEVKMQNRKDVNVMCSWVVTAPKSLKEEETAQFFKETYKFLSERYGRDNVVSAHVHMDETTPHIHFAFVPVVRDKKKDILKVSAKEAVNRLDLQKFHQDLSGYMENIFGRDVGLLNEATKDGNKAIDELKRGTAQKELAEIEEQTKKQTEELQKSSERVKSLKIEEKEIEKQIKDLEKDFKGKKITAADLEKIKPLKGLFGGVRNIKYEDVEKLIRTAMPILQDKKALNAANQEVERLKTENANLKIENTEQKKRIPSTMQEIARKTEVIKLQDVNKRLVDDYNRLLDKYDKIINGLNQIGLSDELIKFFDNIINPPRKENEQDRSDEYER